MFFEAVGCERVGGSWDLRVDLKMKTMTNMAGLILAAGQRIGWVKESEKRQLRFIGTPELQGFIEYPEVKPVAKPVSFGWLHRGKRRAIKPLIRRTDTVCELGAFLGESANWFARRARKVVSVDFFGRIKEQLPDSGGCREFELLPNFMANTWKNRGSIQILQCDAAEAPQILTDAGIHPDVFYVDAGHTFQQTLDTLEAIQKWHPRARIVGDDLRWRRGGVGAFEVEEAVVEFVGRHGRSWNHDGWTYWMPGAA